MPLVGLECVPGTWYEVWGARCGVRGARYGARGTRYEVRSMRYGVRGTRYICLVFWIKCETMPKWIYLLHYYTVYVHFATFLFSLTKQKFNFQNSTAFLIWGSRPNCNLSTCDMNNAWMNLSASLVLCTSCNFSLFPIINNFLLVPRN